MAGMKVDGVIEAVRYAPDGKITIVRAYERHGAVWSDRLLLDRDELVEQLEKGKRYVTGQRKIYLGSRFETGATVNHIDNTIVTGGESGKQDTLAGVPLF